MDLITSLLQMRDAHIIKANQHYHQVVKAIMDEAVGDFTSKIPQLKQALIDNLKNDMCRKGVACEYVVKLDALFKNPYAADSDGRLYKQTDLVECWLRPEGTHQAVRYVCEKHFNYDAYRMFQAYFIHRDPDVQRLRAVVCDAFPNSTTATHELFKHDWYMTDCTGTMELRVTITYTLPAIDSTLLVPVPNPNAPKDVN